jgi:Kyakuja-Dileera-Zisupton transposase
VSGAVVVICSRHCLIRRNGAGDLAKGEKYVSLSLRTSSILKMCSSRYCCVDFIVFATIACIIGLLRIVITYDVICQWSKNFRKHMEEFPEDMQIPDTTQVDVTIPGWHINGHGETCRNNFNLSYMEGVGRTVGEDIETTWAGTNPLAPSVREMGPAARHDTLNDHWNGWNFRKIVGFRKFFCRF